MVVFVLVLMVRVEFVVVLAIVIGVGGGLVNTGQGPEELCGPCAGIFPRLTQIGRGSE
jgi:hypothetical protein